VCWGGGRVGMIVFGAIWYAAECGVVSVASGEPGLGSSDSAMGSPDSRSVGR
jgi:hypothetical protein